jgi:hypothetical protein
MRRTVLLAVVSMVLAGFNAVSATAPYHAAAGGYFYHDSIATSR